MREHRDATDAEVRTTLTLDDGVLAAAPGMATWANPTADDVSTVVRLFEAPVVGVAPDAGIEVYSGSGTAAVLPGLVAGERYELAAFTVDGYGNVGAPATITFTGP